MRDIGEMWGWHYGFSLAGLGMLAGVIVFWDGLRKGVFGDKGLQPAEYVEKKFFNFRKYKIKRTYTLIFQDRGL